MTVNVLFFGATADAVGTRSQQIDTEDSIAGDLLERLVKDHPQLARHKLLFSVNQEYRPADTQLMDGDEIAIFTAVSGG